MRSFYYPGIAGSVVVSLVMGLMSSSALAETTNPDDLLKMSLAELSDIDVTSVSKRSENAFEAPAAIYVVTQEDIQRSGATSIAEALRMVPGLDVAQAGGHEWAISSRGFNSQAANKMLVLIDGRTVYTPLFSDTNWDVQDTFLPDIDRIEVIRGPGATEWGANAVNGVINIITKKASDTQGGYVNSTVGNQQINNGVRYGGKEGDTYYRGYAQENFSDALNSAPGGTKPDDIARKQQVGFRTDTKLGSGDTLTVQGDGYTTQENDALALPISTGSHIQSIADEYMINGGNMLGRWTRKLDAGNEMSLQSYIDYVRIASLPYNDEQATIDLDFQHSFDLTDRQNILWGTGYRYVHDDVTNSQYVTFAPAQTGTSLYNFFLQDKITLVENKVFLTLGSKFEHYSLSGFDYQPSARLSYLIDPSQTLWASVSRAVSTPGRSSEDLRLIQTYSSPVFVVLNTYPNSEPEELVAYETGYRIKPTNNTSLDFSLFYNDYERLFNLTQSSAAPVSPYGLTVLENSYNSGSGSTYGGETTATWQVNRSLKLTGSYSLLQMYVHATSLVNGNLGSPQQQFNARAYWQVSDTVQWDNMLYYVDTIHPSLSSGSALLVPSYVRYDTRIAWKCLDNVELSLVGENLLDNSHAEFAPFLYNNQAEVPRSVYASVRWKF